MHFGFEDCEIAKKYRYQGLLHILGADRGFLFAFLGFQTIRSNQAVEIRFEWLTTLSMSWTYTAWKLGRSRPIWATTIVHVDVKVGILVTPP